jgi:hypothetical protein
VCPYSLDREELIIRSYGVFKVRASRARLRENAGTAVYDDRAGLSKLNSKRLVVEVDVDLGEPEHGRITSGTRSIDKAGSHQ